MRAELRGTSFLCRVRNRAEWGFVFATLHEPKRAARNGLALMPLVVAGNLPGHEIEHPIAVVILGGLIASTTLNLIVLPSLYLRFGRHTRE